MSVSHTLLHQTPTKTYLSKLQPSPDFALIWYHKTNKFLQVVQMDPRSSLKSSKLCLICVRVSRYAGENQFYCAFPQLSIFFSCYVCKFVRNLCDGDKILTQYASVRCVCFCISGTSFQCTCGEFASLLANIPKRDATFVSKKNRLKNRPWQSFYAKIKIKSLKRALNLLLLLTGLLCYKIAIVK